MRKTSRFISMLLPVIMIITSMAAVLPVSAGGGALYDDKIEILVACPVAGEEITEDKYTPVLYNTRDVVIESFLWEDMDDFHMVEAGEKLIAGRTYRITITLLPDPESYRVFDSTSTRVLVNGSDPSWGASFEYPWVPGSIYLAHSFTASENYWSRTEDTLTLDLSNGPIGFNANGLALFRTTMSALEYAGQISIQADDERISYDLNKDGYTDLVLWDEDYYGNNILEVEYNSGFPGNISFSIPAEAILYLQYIRAPRYAGQLNFVFEHQQVEPQPEIEPLPFTDVKETDVFYDAVYWAYFTEPQVTTGVTPDRFGPETELTRGMAVTFLWRACGCPNPANDPDDSKFVDLTADYYKTAVQWAVEEGITKGVDSTHFKPDGTLSLAHMVTFLYRALGIGQDGWYKEAADWALGINLTEDISYTIDPTVKCPRYATVLMLWRTVGECWTPGSLIENVDEYTFFDMLGMTAGEIKSKYGPLTFEGSEHGPGAPTYSLARIPGVAVQFSFNYIDESLDDNMVPVAVLIGRGYNGPILGCYVLDDIHESRDLWTTVGYNMMDETVYLRTGVGPYYVTCIVNAAGIITPEYDASQEEWNTWYYQYMNNPHGTITQFRISSAG